jgi:hypothetical protein
MRVSGGDSLMSSMQLRVVGDGFLAGTALTGTLRAESCAAFALTLSATPLPALSGAAGNFGAVLSAPAADAAADAAAGVGAPAAAPAGATTGAAAVVGAVGRAPLRHPATDTAATSATLRQNPLTRLNDITSSVP